MGVLALYGPYILESVVHDGFAFIKRVVFQMSSMAIIDTERVKLWKPLRGCTCAVGDGNGVYTSTLMSVSHFVCFQDRFFQDAKLRSGQLHLAKHFYIQAIGRLIAGVSSITRKIEAMS